jgi:hypothetical protein
MFQKFMLVLIVAVCSSMQAWSQRADGCSLGPKILNEITSGSAETPQCLPMPGDARVYAVSWTTRSPDGPTSHLRLISVKADSLRILQKIELPDGFASTLELSREFTEGQKSLLVVLTQYGAAASEIRILAVSPSSLRPIFRVLADNVDFIPIENGNLVIAAHHHLNGIDVPDLYQFRSGKFAKCDSSFPGYYQKLLSAQHLSADSVVSPSLVPQLVHLLLLSGDAKGAEHVSERTRQR